MLNTDFHKTYQVSSSIARYMHFKMLEGAISSTELRNVVKSALNFEAVKRGHVV